MLFTSYEFVAFLIITFLLYYLVPKKAQWIILLALSYGFYLFSGVENLIFIVFTTLSSWLVAMYIEKINSKTEAYLLAHREDMDKEARKAYKAARKKTAFSVLCLGLVLGFGILAVLKYTGFAIVNINSLLHLFGAQDGLAIPDLILPLGLSFYVFQTMGYLIDVYRGKAKAERNLARLALFVSFFPQLIQGPISRYNDLGEQLYTPHSFSGSAFFSGIQRMTWGYFKKLVIADRILIGMRAMLEDTGSYNGAWALLLIILYSVEIYADFTGGIDITIGIAESLGIKLKENFKHPFISKSTKEYWNRWHITMGSWFTDYVFYPLSVCRPMQTVSKKSRKLFGNAIGKRIPVYIATIVTWFLTGLWHGAAWNFIVWGLLNCLVILVSQELEPLYHRFRTKFPRLTASKPYGAFMIARTFLLMGFIRSLDCYRDVPTTFSMWGSIFTTANYGELFSGGLAKIGLDTVNLAIIISATLVVCAVNYILIKKGRDLREGLAQKPFVNYSLFAVVLLLILLFGAYGVGYDASDFIYKQF